MDRAKAHGADDSTHDPGAMGLIRLGAKAQHPNEWGLMSSERRFAEDADGSFTQRLTIAAVQVGW